MRAVEVDGTQEVDEEEGNVTEFDERSPTLG